MPTLLFLLVVVAGLFCPIVSVQVSILLLIVEVLPDEHPS